VSSTVFATSSGSRGRGEAYLGHVNYHGHGIVCAGVNIDSSVAASGGCVLRGRLAVIAAAIALLACAHGPKVDAPQRPDLRFTARGSMGFVPLYVDVTVRSDADVCNDLVIVWGDGDRTARSDYCATTTRVWTARHIYRYPGEYSIRVFVAGREADCERGCAIMAMESIVGN
jgi:hypothetical protein